MAHIKGLNKYIIFQILTAVLMKTHVFWCVTLSRLIYIKKDKGLPQQAEVAQGVPGRLRSQIILTFGTTSVVGCLPYASAAFTPGEIPGTHI